MRLIRKILKGISLTAAMFVFQACYGTQYYFDETNLTFRVVSEETGEPLPDVKVETQLAENDTTGGGDNYWSLCCYTDSMGVADVYAITSSDLTSTKFRFTDTNSHYAVKDTVVDEWSDTVEIVLSRVRHAI